MATTVNPFAEFGKMYQQFLSNAMATPGNPFTDFSRMFEQFSVPGVDMAAIVEARRKDIEALTEANRIAFEGMQSLVQRQTEILRRSMEEVQAAAKDMAAGGKSMGAGSMPADFAQQAFHKAFENMRELAEMATKSQKEAIEVISKRALQNVEEMKKMMRPK
jgi:phasin family protein